MKKREVIQLWNLLSAFDKKDTNPRFSYFIAINKSKIKHVVDAIQSASIQIPGMVAYDIKRHKIAKSLCRKYLDEQPIIVNGQYTFEPAALDQFRAQMIELNKEYSNVIIEQNKRNESVEKLLDEEIEIFLEMIDLKDYPPTITDQSLMDQLVYFGLIGEWED